MRKVLLVALCGMGAAAWLLGLWQLSLGRWALGCVLMVGGGIVALGSWFAVNRDEGAITTAVVELLGELFHWS